jgi:hypothetical protein
MREFFARRLDDGLLHGNGVAPNPKGVFSVAPDAAAGDTLWDAVTVAKGEIVAAGGTPTTTLALDPVAVVQEEGRIDANGYPVYRDGLTRYNGLDVVAVPALAAGEALVYDRTEVFWVVAEDFTITPSRDYARPTTGLGGPADLGSVRGRCAEPDQGDPPGDGHAVTDS